MCLQWVCVLSAYPKNGLQNVRSYKWPQEFWTRKSETRFPLFIKTFQWKCLPECVLWRAVWTKIYGHWRQRPGTKSIPNLERFTTSTLKNTSHVFKHEDHGVSKLKQKDKKSNRAFKPRKKKNWSKHFLARLVSKGWKRLNAAWLSASKLLLCPEYWKQLLHLAVIQTLPPFSSLFQLQCPPPFSKRFPSSLRRFHLPHLYTALTHSPALLTFYFRPPPHMLSPSLWSNHPSSLLPLFTWHGGFLWGQREWQKAGLYKTAPVQYFPQLFITS